MNFNQMMTAETIVLDYEATDKWAAIKHIGETLLKLKRIETLAGFLEDVRAREALASTNMEMGLAIPHSKSEFTLKSSVSFMRLKTPVDWEDGGSFVRYIFLLAISPNDEGVSHLQVIAKVAELLIEDSFLEVLETASDSEAITNYIETYLAQ